jgi:hypothetical protein
VERPAQPVARVQVVGRRFQRASDQPTRFLSKFDRSQVFAGNYDVIVLAIAVRVGLRKPLDECLQLIGGSLGVRQQVFASLCSALGVLQGAFVGAQSRQGSLEIQIHEQDANALRRKKMPKVGAKSRLADATLEVDERHNLRLAAKFSLPLMERNKGLSLV